MKMQKNHPTLFAEIIAGLLVFLFLYASLSKLSDINFFTNQLHRFPFIKEFSGVIAWLIPLSELLVVAMLLIPGNLMRGFFLSTLLLSLFTIYLFIMLLIKHDKLPCSCGGVLKYLSWGQHILFNIVFILLALAGIWTEKIYKQYQLSETQF